MLMATNYRKRAEECIEIAQTVRTSAQRTMLLHIAQTWINLAKDAESHPPVGMEKAPETSTLN